MPEKNKKGKKEVSLSETSSKGGKACLKVYGRDFYRDIARKRWAQSSGAKPADKSRKAALEPKASGKTTNVSRAKKIT